MAVQDLPIVGDSFALGYRFQRHWDTSMANAFFFGELGAGVFLVSLLCGFAPGMIAGLLITGLLKTYFHVTHMGIPGKAWRAVLRPDRSWISRGLISIVCLMSFGGAYALVMALDLQSAWGLSPVVTTLLKVLAVAAALVVMTYQGFAMSHSTAIALWNTGLMPVASLVFASTGGVMLTLVAAKSGLFDASPGTERALVHAGLGLLVVVAIAVLALLHGAHHGSPGGRKSVELLTRTYFAKWFYGCIWVVGLALPAVLLSVGGDDLATVAVAAAGQLVGYYAFRLLMFKAGVYEPIMNFRP